MYTLFRKSQFKNALPASLGCRTMLLLLLSMTLLLIVMPMEAQAAGKDFLITNRAADPVDYPHIFPGTVTAPVGSGVTPAALNLAEYGNKPGDSLNSLTPQNLALGQIIVFEFLIEAKSSLPANDPGIITFSYFWDTQLENNGDFGYDENYGVIAAFVDTSDTGNVNRDGDELVTGFTWKKIQNDNDLLIDSIHGTFNVEGLDAGNKVVVEVWVVLDKTITASNSNIASGMIAANTLNGDTINTGTNKIPLQRVQEFFSSQADVSVTKSDDPDDAVDQGEQLTYTLTVKNNAADTVANGVVVTDKLDPNVVYVSAYSSPSIPVADILYDLPSHTVTFNVGSLSPLESKTLTIVTTVADNAPTTNIPGLDPVSGAPGTRPTNVAYDLCNEVSVTAITADPTPGNNFYYEPTNVLEPTYLYHLDTSCESLVLSVTSPYTSGTSLTADWYYDTGTGTDSVQHDGGIQKVDGVYITYTPTSPPTPPNPVENGEWYVKITEYSGTTVIGEDRYDFTVDQGCNGPEFPVGPVVFLVIAGVMYLTMRRKMDGS